MSLLEGLNFEDILWIGIPKAFIQKKKEKFSLMSKTVTMKSKQSFMTFAEKTARFSTKPSFLVGSFLTDIKCCHSKLL